MYVSEKEKDSIRLSLKKLWTFYPVSVDKKNYITLASKQQEDPFSTKDEENLEVLSTALGSAMEKSNVNQPALKFQESQHRDIIVYSCDHNSVPENYGEIAGGKADDPDYWWSDQWAWSYNHGYIPLLGIGLAPANCKANATQAKDKYRYNQMTDAFESLGHSSHFMVDLGNPLHTGGVLEQAVWEILGRSIHTAYEDYVNRNWDNNFAFSEYARTTFTEYQVTDPESSAISLAEYSSDYSTGLVILIENNWLRNRLLTGEGKFTLEDVPRIRTITQNNIIETTKYTNGLVDYVIRDGPIQFTITATAGEHGSITPSGDVSVNYGDDQTFTIEPATGYAIDDVIVDGVSRGALSEYTFEEVTADHSISATFKANVQPSSPLEVSWTSMSDWDGWSHTSVWGGPVVGDCYEYGPTIVSGHGEHGAVIHLNRGWATSTVERTFTPASGDGWNTLEFTGVLSATDVPSGRWITISVNGQQVYHGIASENPPGNGQLFSTGPLRFSTDPAESVTVLITNGHDPIWGAGYHLEYHALTLSYDDSEKAVVKSEPFEKTDPKSIVTNTTESVPVSNLGK